jgi:hypothetical protein
MKKLILGILLFAAPALADVTISATFTDGQAARIERARARVNKETCKYRGLPADCTTTQVRQQFCKTNGIGGQPILDKNGNQTGTTPLVSDCPGATQFIVYPSAESYVKRTLLDKINDWQTQDEADDKAAAKAAWDAKTQPQRDAICVSLGLPAGCVAF